ncbi:MAG: dihydrodipicolinate synthase family protein [Phycisphaerales bacterium]|nr:MAG: dihydrodipicolinate synthase family protein [Phycisphaerales bacterium]
MKTKEDYTGLFAAVFTPMREDGSLDLARVPAVVEYMLRVKIDGLYVCGSTGEGPSLSSEERRATAAAYVEASAARLPVIVQVGHNSLAEARELATHAQSIGAEAISALPPSYYGFKSVGTLTDCLAEIAAAAPNLPLFYYHIPSLSHVRLNVVELLGEARNRLPGLAGIKYSDNIIDEFRECIEFENRRYTILFGSDDLLLSALAVGATGAIGSTYNFAAPLYRRLINAFNAGNLDEAQKHQKLAVEMIQLLSRYGAQPAFKATMKLLGVDCGPTRLPLEKLSSEQMQQLKEELDRIGFFEWALPEP